MGTMRGYCGLEVSSWFVWLAAGKRASLGGGSFFFFSKEGVQPAGLKEMGLGFCGCLNFFVFKLRSSKFSPPFYYD